MAKEGHGLSQSNVVGLGKQLGDLLLEEEDGRKQRGQMDQGQGGPRYVSPQHARQLPANNYYRGFEMQRQSPPHGASYTQLDKPRDNKINPNESGLRLTGRKGQPVNGTVSFSCTMWGLQRRQVCFEAQEHIFEPKRVRMVCCVRSCYGAFSISKLEKIPRLSSQKCVATRRLVPTRTPRATTTTSSATKGTAVSPSAAAEATSGPAEPVSATTVRSLSV